MLACDHEAIHPDILILGKALSGGLLPVSAILPMMKLCCASSPVSMAVPMAENPLAAKVAIAALEVLREEKLAENAARLGKILLEELQSIKHEMIQLVRGKGLFCAMVIKPYKGKDAWDVCIALKDAGLLAKPTHGDIIRFAPPLVINEEQLRMHSDHPGMWFRILIFKRKISNSFIQKIGPADFSCSVGDD